ncbi:MFS transporter [Candidatus Pelagibacter sp.]|jgi:MFS transporter, PAT family, beta-lactamase induction signal transducer AmpG|nr:MFS transporter [Candidatus Pelagibacter sp.]
MDFEPWNDLGKIRIICYTSVVSTFILEKLIMIEIKKQSLSETFSVYFDKRMLRILLLGAISGFPWVLIGSSLSLWLKEEGLSRSTIGWAGLIFAVYAFNYLWAPLIDRLQIPYLTKKLGHRRGWIVLMQIAILICLITWSFINPTENLALLISVGLIIAIASATQDITVDALRIEQIGVNENKSMAAGAAMAVVGWWSGYKLGGVIALFTAEYFENIGISNYWQITFLILGIVIILMNIGLMFVHEKHSTDRQIKQKETDKLIENKFRSKNIVTSFTVWISSTLGGPIISFFKKNGFSIALGILSFVFLFKIGEAFLGRMSIVFYKEIGFSKGDIAIYSKTLGWITTVIFTLLGGLFVIRSGVLKAMFLAGILMAVTNLLFTLLAWSDKSELLFAVAVIFDDIAAAFATVAFVAFISLLVDRTYTATQYALLASIGTAGRTTLASSSGALVDWLNGDWGVFFILTAIMVIPSLICLWFIKDKLKLREK